MSATKQWRNALKAAALGGAQEGAAG
eukprot:SAG11_NODE_12066_length_723_cov_1.250000_1_plen_25_part_10